MVTQLVTVRRASSDTCRHQTVTAATLCWALASSAGASPVVHWLCSPDKWRKRATGGGRSSIIGPMCESASALPKARTDTPFK